MEQYQEPLKPYHFENFKCDSCQKEFRQTTAYAYSPNLKITYCANCAIKESKEPETCSFRQWDPQTKQPTFCDKPLFDKKKLLCRSHNRQIWKIFNTFLEDKSVSSTAAWYEVWEQSGDWKYFWNLGVKKAKTAKNKPKKTKDQRITGRTRQLNLKVKAQTYQKLKAFSLKEKCLMTEILEKALKCYEKHKE